MNSASNSHQSTPQRPGAVSRVGNPEVPMDVDVQEFKVSDVTELSTSFPKLDTSQYKTIFCVSKNAIRDICDQTKQAQIKNATLIVQAVDVKIFGEADNKKNIRQR